jgi:WS/DGAT/MGAT family acyltransferase
MSRLAPLDIAFLVLETPSRPMHAGALMLFDPPAEAGDGKFVDRVLEEFADSAPVAPFDRRPRLGLSGPARWESCEQIDLGYHVRRVVLPAPGTSAQLMELVGHLYPALLDRSRPLWECYVIEGLENGGFAVLYKLHHALADGITGARMLFGSLSDTADDERISPLWAGGRSRPRRKRDTARRRPPNPIGLAWRGAGTVAEAGRLVAGMVPQVLGLRKGATALPFSAPRLSAAQRRQSGARSFAIFDLSISEARRVAERAGGSVNDVVLSVCDDAMQRYLAEKGERVEAPLVASMAVSTRAKGDDSPSNAAALAQVRLGAPEASPGERLEQVVSSTSAAKAMIRRSSPGVLQLQSLAFFGAAQLREELPIGRGIVPEAANLLVSNIPGGPKESLYLGGARLASIHATPILPPSHAVNFTLASYADRLCFGIGAARNVIPDTQRIADLATECFADLAHQREEEQCITPT